LASAKKPPEAELQTENVEFEVIRFARRFRFGLVKARGHDGAGQTVMNGCNPNSYLTENTDKPSTKESVMKKRNSHYDPERRRCAAFVLHPVPVNRSTREGRGF